MWLFWTTQRFSLFEIICIAPCLKLVKLQFEIWTFELIVIAPEVWSVSLPINSQPIRFNEVYGKLTRAQNFYLSRFGIDLSVSVHSRRIIPPEFKQTMQSMLRLISNSSRDLTQALGRYSTSCMASKMFSKSLMPECAKVIRLKLTSWPFSSLTLMTGP